MVPIPLANTKNSYPWRFFRVGGFDQVRLDRGADIAHLDQLDQKLWVALACPTTGLEFDTKTLALIDTDHDSRVRAPEIIAASKWACSLLKDPDLLLKASATLPLEAINDSTPEGQQILASAKQILANLDKTAATEITLDDAADTTRIFTQARFNGDGIIPADSVADPALKAIVTDILACVASDVDRSGKPGLSLAKLDLFFGDAQAYCNWQTQPEKDAAILPFGDHTPAAFAALEAVRLKVDDYFARCRLAAYDSRATAALNRAESEYLTIATRDLTFNVRELLGFPLARIVPDAPMPLKSCLNPAWAGAVETLRNLVVEPVLGDTETLTEANWLALQAKFTAYRVWLAANPLAAKPQAATVQVLPLPRLREILASGAREQLAALIAQDQALEGEFNAIANVEKLLRYCRDLAKLLNNFVAFRDFYARKDKAVFQVGTLYLDQRSCELCVRVDDMTRHGAMAHLAYTYLAYCDCVRRNSVGPAGVGEKMTIAAAFTAGDSDNLMVGRNGVFYDRSGRDWDATITKIVEHPISIRQAFWAPYKAAARFIADQIAKRAANADTVAKTRLQAASTEAVDAAATGVTPPPPPPAARVDVGVVAAMGVAVGALTTALGVFLTWLSAVPKTYLPVYMILVLLLISTPSMILAALKLRLRNLGPILDANGWAVNTRARINIPFGGALTRVASLPPGAQRDLFDPFAEKKTLRYKIAAAVLVLAGLWAMWFFGVFERAIPGILPKSAWVAARQTAATQPSAVAASQPAGSLATHPAPAATQPK